MDYEKSAVELLEKMHELHKAKPHKQINEALQGEAFILHYIAVSKKSVLPGDIGLEMNVSSARVAAALNSLENKRLITRRIDPNDRRKIIVEITPEGKDFAEKHYQTVITGVSKLLYLLGENDAKEYVRILGRVTEIMPDLWLDWQNNCL